MSDLISKAAAIQAVFDWEQGKISGTISDAIAAIPATDARADALRKAAAIVMEECWKDREMKLASRIEKRILALIGEAKP